MDGIILWLSNNWLILLAGALVTLFIERLFKIFSLCLWPRRANYHITLLSSGSEEFFKSSSRGNFSLDVKYNGEQIKDIVAISTFRIYNDGRNDLSYSNHFEQPIIIRSTEYDIIDAISVGDSSVNPDVSVDDNHLVKIKWGILKKDESLKIQLIGILKNSSIGKKSSLFDSLEFKIRSDCINAINRSIFSFKEWFWLMTLAFLFVFIIMYFADKSLFIQEVKEIPTYSFNINDTTFSGAIKYDSLNSITVCDLNDSIKNVSADNYLEIKDFERNSSKLSFLLTMLISYIVALLFGGAVSIYENSKKKPKSFV